MEHTYNTLIQKRGELKGIEKKDASFASMKRIQEEAAFSDQFFLENSVN